MKKKIVKLTLIVILIHLFGSLCYILISKKFHLYDELNNYELFMYAFKTYYVSVLIPYIFGVYHIIKKDKNQK